MPQHDEKLLSQLKELLTSPLTMREIVSRLNLAKEEKSRIRKKIREFTLSGAIVRIRGARYGLPEKMNLVKGVVQGNPGRFGFLIPDDENEEDVYLGPRNFDIVMHGDRAVVRIESTRDDGKRQGSVIRPLDRAHETVAGTYQPIRLGGYLIPFDPRISRDILIPQGFDMSAIEGQAVVARIVDYPSRKCPVTGEIIKILGDPDDPKVERELIVAKYDLKSIFPEKSVTEAVRVAKPPTKKEVGRRLDLRQHTVVTIDGETAQDFDDAVEVKKLGGGGWSLGVHIADVSHYVKEGSSLDKSAFARGTSVYFPGTVLPMLPFELSNDICSLKPKVDRLTLSAIMTLDSNGSVQKCEVAESIIRSSERMTYTEVANILEEGTKPPSLASLVPMFFNMRELAMILRERRLSGGSLDFDLPEPCITLGEDGFPEMIAPTPRNVAHQIIEEFMLTANRAVADYLIKRDYPALFRVHDDPDPVKIESVRKLLATFGVTIPKEIKIRSSDLQAIMEKLAGAPEQRLATTVILRSMAKAKYSKDNTGHFGLAFDHYVHFTSPIRRYPDLVIHRLLKDLLKKERRAGYWNDALDKIGANNSISERNAMEAEREMVKVMQAQYMSEYIGESYDGIISGVSSFGFFVELLDPPVEGMVRLTSVTDDYYRYEESDQALYGEKRGKRFRVGDPVRITVVSVSVKLRRIDFVLEGSDTGLSRRKTAKPKFGRKEKKRRRR